MRDVLARQAAAVVERHMPEGMARDEVGILSEALSSEPVGPLVLLGAEGVGTSSIARAALAEARPSLLLHINLREVAARGEHQCRTHSAPSTHRVHLPSVHC